MSTVVSYILIAAAITIPVILGYFAVGSAKKKYVAKHAKTSDATAIFTLCTSVLGIAVCLIAMTTLTYAWYVDSVSSTANVIKAGTFSMNMVVDDSSSNVDANAEYAFTAENLNLKFNLTGNTKGYAVVSLYNTNTDDADVIKYQTRTLDPSLEADITAVSNGFDVCSYGYTKIKMEYVWGESNITSGDFVCITEASLNTQSANYTNSIMAGETGSTKFEEVDSVEDFRTATAALGAGNVVKIKLTADVALVDSNDTVTLGNYFGEATADTLYIDLNGFDITNTLDAMFYVGANSKLVVYNGKTATEDKGIIQSNNYTIRYKDGAKIYILDNVEVKTVAADSHPIEKVN